MITRRGLTIALMATLLTIALAGCSSSGSGGSSSPTGGGSDDPATKPSAAWLNDGASIALVTWGSSSADCTPSAADVQADGQTVKVALATPNPNAVCTMDFVPRGTYIAVPDGVTASRDATVSYRGDEFEGSAALAGNSALTGQPEDGQSSASWFEPGGIVLLTWGSSGCPPVVQNIEESDHGATVTFQTDPAKACTADFSPRLTMLQVTPPADSAGYLLHLVGDNLDGQITVID